MKNQLLQQLYIKYQKEIYLYLFSLSHNSHIAEDLTQETFLKALLSLSDSHSNMRAWLYTVARNLYFNYRKKETQNISLEDMDDILQDEKSAQLLNRLLLDERSRLLFQALQHLNYQKREVLTLQYYGGFCHT